MMYAFRNMHIFGPEHFIDGFLTDEAQDLPRHLNLVLKRTSDCLGGEYPDAVVTDDSVTVDDYLRKIFRVIRGLNLRLIDIVRDPRDVLTSRHHSKPDDYYVDYERWLQHHEEMEWLKERWDKLLQVKFENLLREPDRVQTQISNFLNLEKKASFSNYPEFIEKSSLPEDQRKALKGFRELNPDKIGRWRETDPEYILEQTRKHPELLDLLREYEYESDDSWQEELAVRLDS